MGRGRSGAGSKIGSIVVDFGEGGTREYRKGPKGQVYAIENGVPNPIATKLSLEAIAKRAKENGYSVETYNAQQTQERDVARAAARAKGPDWELGVGIPGGNRDYRRTARRNRINERARKRSYS